jgi:hypothetical protein
MVNDTRRILSFPIESSLLVDAMGSIAHLCEKVRNVYFRVGDLDQSRREWACDDCGRVKNET